ncbi:MAG: lipopolysaccharide biosynthesis protein [Rhizobiaceae bacterium]|nr:lipopolysaccharide biosynthesis protein [Rhizobiaceae bacterium]
MRFSAATLADRILPSGLRERVRPSLNRIDLALFSNTEHAKAGRMSIAAFLIRIVSALLALAMQILLARWMASFEYGIFVLVWTTVVIGGSIASFGFHTSVIRYVSEYRERSMLAELQGVLRTSRIFTLLVSTFLAALGIGSVWLLQSRIEAYYIVPLYLGMICLPMIALGDVLEGIARGNSWAYWALGPIYLLRPALILAFMAIAIWLGYPADAPTAMTAAILATYLTTLAQLGGVNFSLGKTMDHAAPAFRLREWIAVSLPIFLVESFFFLLTNMDVLMVGYFLEPDDVGVYFATVKTLALVHFVYFAVKAGAAQRYAQFAHTDPAQLARFARDTVTWTFWPSLALAVVVLLIGKPLLMLFGNEFAAGYPLLFAQMIGVLARASVGPAESLLTMSGNQKACARVYGVTLALNIALCIILIPKFGLWGAAIASALSMMFEAAALSWTAWKQLGVAMTIFLPATFRGKDI